MRAQAGSGHKAQAQGVPGGRQGVARPRRGGCSTGAVQGGHAARRDRRRAAAQGPSLTPLTRRGPGAPTGVQPECCAAPASIEGRLAAQRQCCSPAEGRWPRGSVDCLLRQPVSTPHCPHATCQAGSATVACSPTRLSLGLGASAPVPPSQCGLRPRPRRSHRLYRHRHRHHCCCRPRLPPVCSRAPSLPHLLSPLLHPSMSALIGGMAEPMPPSARQAPSAGRANRGVLRTAVPLGALAMSLAAMLAALVSSPVPAVAAPPVGTGIGQANNVTSLSGTWSSGAGHVLTGLGFYNPANNSFNYPQTAGISYSFTDDGFFEEAQYQYKINGSDPYCVSAFLIWQHGIYTINNTNWLHLLPFKADGAMLQASRCDSSSERVQWYSQTEQLKGFQIGLDTHYDEPAYYLQLYDWDGSLKPLMWQRFNPPQMLPTQPLKQAVRALPSICHSPMILTDPSSSLTAAAAAARGASWPFQYCGHSPARFLSLFASHPL